MIILGILLVGFILRLVNLGQSLWLDEAVQAITAQNSLSYIFQEIRGDFHPPLYYFLMHFWVRVFGISEIALRMPSVLFGVGAIYLVYKICNLSNLRHLRYLSAVLLATAPFHIYYSQEARMYSMACFLASISMYFFMKINGLKDYREKGISRLKLALSEVEWARNDNILYFIFTILMIYSDYYGFLVLLAQMIYLLIKKKYKFLILNSLFIILCYLPWFPMFITQIKTGMLATQNLPEWSNLVNVSFWKALPLTFIKFSIGRITIFNKSFYAGIVLILGLFYGCLFFKSIKGWLKEKLKDEGMTVTMLWFTIPLTVSWLSSLFIPNFQPFRLLLILPAFYLILAIGTKNLPASMIQIIEAIVIIINLTSIAVYYFNPYFQRENWRGLVKYLQEQKDPVVLLPSSVSNWPIRYYDPDGKIKLEAGIDGVGEIEPTFVPLSGTSVYYIRYLVPVFDPDERILVNLEANGYTKIKEISFNQIPLWEFSK